MPKKTGTTVEAEHHINGVRFRLNGSGNLVLILEDYDAIQSMSLVPLVMQVKTRIEPTRLSNFQSQRTRLIGKITEIDEWFQIGRIIIFAKPVAIEYPG
jgi:hypothetical protein